MRGEDGRIACVRYVLPRHKAANWVGPGRGRKSSSYNKPLPHDTFRRQRPNSWPVSPADVPVIDIHSL